MAINVHNSKWLLLALLSLATVSGCFCQAIPLPGENQCPTDARRLYCTCGEEAVRRCPCGPDREFYGLKPTCWREWPEGWQCNGCEGMPYVDRALCGEPVAEASSTLAPAVEEPESAGVDVSNPFRSKPGAAALPLSPETPQAAPKQSAPAKTAPVQLIPAQPSPTAPPALEKVPTKTAPAKETPIQTAPAAKKTTSEKPTDGATSIVVAPPKTPVAAPPITSAVQVEVAAPNLMPIVPAAIKMTAAAPVLMPPQNATTDASVTKPNPKPVQVASAPKAEKKQAVKKTEMSAKKHRADDPALSNRVEQHLINNLRL